VARFKVCYDLIKSNIFYVEADSAQQAIAKVEMDDLLEPDDSEEWELDPYAEEVDDDVEE